MLSIPCRISVCVYERSRRGLLRSDNRLIFLGKLHVLPILFLGANGYFSYLAGYQLFRSTVFSELKHIMSAACLDNTYYVEDWFVKKGRLLVHVARRVHRIKREMDSPWKLVKSRLKRLLR